MSDNYTEETHLLFRLLRTKSFRFVVVRYNHFSLVQRLEQDIQQKYPQKKIKKFNAENADFNDLMQAYDDLGEGVFWVEYFEDVLKEEKTSLGKETLEMAANNRRRRGITAGLNLRRDKLARSPIVLIVFVAPSASEFYIKTIMEKMPDLWSFRSLILNLEREFSPVDSIREIPYEVREVSALSNRQLAEKREELKRLTNLLTNVPSFELTFKVRLLPQIFLLHKELGEYKQALSILEQWERFSDKEEIGRIDFERGDVLERMGNLELALSSFNKCLIKTKQAGNEIDMSTCLARLGFLYLTLGNLKKALQCFNEFHRLSKKLCSKHPNNIEANRRLSNSYEYLGITWQKLNDLDRSLTYFKKCNSLAKKLFTQNPSNASLKIRLAFSYQYLGHVTYKLDQPDKKIKNIRSSHILLKELHMEYPTNWAYKHQVAISYCKIGNYYRIIDDKVKAQDYYQTAEKHWLELVEASPTNANFRKFLNIVKNDLKDISIEARE